MQGMNDSERHEYVFTLFWLVLIAFVVIFAGIGLRDPWPADEPRFVEVAREMVASGNWFFPMRGGELYPDKPPVFMWSMALLYRLTDNLSWTFLIPNAVAALITLLCVYDLGARLWNVTTGRNAALLLLIAPQFLIQAKTAQIDAMVACWITLGMYGLLRYFFLRGSLGWYLLAWVFMALGIITKGVGFLPLLVFIPLLVLHFTGRQSFSDQWDHKLWFGPLAMLAVLLCWLLPVIYFSYTSHNPDFAAYRDNILFKQTAERYANSWGHIKPWYYFAVSVIPVFWFPLYLLIARKGALLSMWRSPLAVTLASWVILVVVFFSLSPGKRGLYILPALPMLALLVGAYSTPDKLARWLQGLLAGLAALLSVAAIVVAVAALIQLDAVVEQVGPRTWPFALMFFALAAIWGLVVWYKRFAVDLRSYTLALLATWLLYSLVGYSLLNPVRTPAKAVMQQVVDNIEPGAEVGITRFKEQFLLFSPIALTHFSYLTSSQQQDRNAWLWMKEQPGRYILTQNDQDLTCFDASQSIDLGEAHRRHWILLGQDSLLETCPKPERVVRYHQPFRSVYR